MFEEVHRGDGEEDRDAAPYLRRVAEGEQGERQKDDVELVQVVGRAEVGDAATVVGEGLLPGVDAGPQEHGPCPLEVFAGGDGAADAAEERGCGGDGEDAEDDPAEAVELC